MFTLESHEAFPCASGMMALARLAAAEVANNRYTSQYPWEDRSICTLTGKESSICLPKPYKLRIKNKSKSLALQFLNNRSARKSAHLTENYVEPAAGSGWRVWGLPPSLRSGGRRLPALTRRSREPALNDFDHYAGYRPRWAQEVADAPDGR